MSESEAVAGVGLLVAAFTQEDAADQALKALKKAKKDKQFYFEEAAVIRQDESGKVHHHETGDMSTGKGAGIGTVIGGVVGILGGIPGVIAGAAIGASVGAIGASGDAGFDDESLEDIGVALKPQTSALVAVTSSDLVKAARKSSDKKDLKDAIHNLADGISADLEAGNDSVFVMTVTTEGVSVSKLTANDEAVQIMQVVSTEDGVAAGAAVITDDGVAYEVGVATEDGVIIEEGVVTEGAAAIVDAVVTEDGAVVVGTVVTEDEELTDTVETTSVDNETEEDKTA